MGLIKEARRRNRISQLTATVEAGQAAIKLQIAQVARLQELVNKLVAKLASIGIQIKFEKGELVFEAITHENPPANG